MDKNKINTFIKIKIKEIKGYSSSLCFFDELKKFLLDEQMTFEYDDLTYLLRENKEFYDLVKSIFARYEQKIIAGYLERLFDNHLLISSIELYCSINGIEIENVNNTLKGSNSNEDIYFQEISQFPLLNKEKEIEYIDKAHKGDLDFKRKVTESNLRLVASEAKKMTGKGMPLLDLIQEGNLALSAAIDGFDTSLGYRFSTYAVPKIRQAMRRAIDNQSSNIRIPIETLERVRKTLRVQSELLKKIHRKPTINEIAIETGFREEQVKYYLNIKIDTISINHPINEEGDIVIADFLKADGENPESRTMLTSFQREFRRFLMESDLPIKYLEILKLHFGFFNNIKFTFEEIGEIYGVSRKRTNQIADLALNKLFCSCGMIKFLGHVDYSREVHDSLYKKLSIYNKETGTVPIGSYRSSKNSNKPIAKKECVRINKSIYSILNYSEEEIDSILPLLSKSDIAVLNLCYGESIKMPKFNVVSIPVKERFVKYLIPKMRLLIESLKKEKTYQKNIGTMVS